MQHGQTLGEALADNLRGQDGIIKIRLWVDEDSSGQITSGTRFVRLENDKGEQVFAYMVIFEMETGKEVTVF